MALSHQSNQQRTADPVYRKFHRACLAACIILAPLVLLLGFVFDPTGGVGVPETRILIAEFQAANPLNVQLFLYLYALTPYVFPLSYIGLALPAMKRSPWLATTGMIFGLLGSLPFGMFAGATSLAASLAEVGYSPTADAISQHFAAQGPIFWLQTTWVIGHLFGYVFLGFALGRSHAIPWWAAGLILVAAPIMGPFAYGLHLGILQILGFALVFTGSIPAALAMSINLRTVEFPE